MSLALMFFNFVTKIILYKLKLALPSLGFCEHSNKDAYENAKLSQRRLFVLDIDENLASIQLDEDEPHNLSKSAERSLSQSALGIIDKPELTPGLLWKKQQHLED